MEVSSLLAVAWFPLSLLGGLVVLLARLEMVVGDEEGVEAHYETLKDQVYEERCRATYRFAENVTRAERYSEAGVPEWIRRYRKELENIVEEEEELKKWGKRYIIGRSFFHWSLIVGTILASVSLVAAVTHVFWATGVGAMWVTAWSSLGIFLVGIFAGLVTRKMGTELRSLGKRAIYRRIQE